MLQSARILTANVGTNSEVLPVARATRSIALLLVLLFIFLFFEGVGRSQAVGGAITGTVKDPQGAVLQGGTASATNVETGVVAATTTNAAGLFHFANLQPGRYDLQVTADGMSMGIQKDIQLNVGAEAVINFALKIADVASTIEVLGQAAAVNLVSSSMSYDISGTTIREIPLNGRDFTSLAALQPGVTSLGTLGGMRAGLGNKLSVSGSRPSNNNFLFDGISINDSGNNTPGSILGVTLGVDAVDQFTLLSNTFSAEYGRASGGVINALTRSGTNGIKGSAFYFGRNNAFDANNFFDVKDRLPKFRRHQFGGSIGGPAVKDKTFWFADYEGVKQFLGTTTISTVPSAALRQGIFVNPANNQTTVYTVDPNIARALPLYPLPNAGLIGAGNTGNFSAVLDNIASEKYLLGRGDHVISEKDMLHGSYFFDDGTATVPDAFLNKVTATTSRRQGASVEYTRMISPAMVNVARVGLSRSVFQSGVVKKVLNPAIADPTLAFVPGLDVGGITVSGLTGLPAGPRALDYGFANYTSFQGYENFYLTKGSHSLKFGVNVDRMRYNTSQPNLTGGSFSFGSLQGFITNGLQNTNPAITFAATFAGTNTERGIRETLIGTYVQDDWKVLDRLTVNLGLRYEFTTVPTEAQGKIALLPDLFAGAPRIGGPVQDRNSTLKDFAPRVGFAWDPKGDGTMAVRAGFGMFDNLPLPYLFDTPLMRSFPFFTQGVITRATTPELAGAFPGAAYGLFNNGTLRTAYVDTAPGRSYAMQWNLNVERKFKGWVATAGYVGSRGVHLVQVERNMNTAQPVKTEAGWFYGPNTQKLNPGFASINTTDSWNGDSTYNSMQVSVSHPMSAGLQMQASYAFSKSIDDTSSTSSVTSGTGYPNAIGSPAPLIPEINRGLSDFYVKHNATISAVWAAPPVNYPYAPMRAALNGWQISSIFSIRTGTPFSIVLNNDPGNGTKADTTGAQLGTRPNRVSSSECSSLTNPGQINGYIKTGCFTYPTPVTVNGVTGYALGNLARNTLIAPGLTNLDFSLIKNSRISERLSAQFRAETFNLLNHPNFSAPPFVLFDGNGNVNGNAGRITSTSNSARQVQFGLKFIF